MKFSETTVTGVLVVDLEPHPDERGFFARAWENEAFAARGLSAVLSQVNIAFNDRAGTLRGLHFQFAPHADAKLVRCTRGALFDVAVDLRPSSPTYLRWYGVELSADERRALYIPEGCAHGYQTLIDGTEAMYLHSAPYVPASEGGARFDDPAFAIDWPPAVDRVLSEKDRGWPSYEVVR